MHFPDGSRLAAAPRNAQLDCRLRLRLSRLTFHIPEATKMSTSSKLFEPYKLGPITLPNRVVMAPLTRNRAVAGLVPSPLAVEYYGQRASAGLLITEASQVSQQGQGYQDTPGIYSKEQIAGWRKVTDRVHEPAGASSSSSGMSAASRTVDLQRTTAAPVAPSAIRAKGKTFVGGTFADVSEPRALTLEEIPGIIESFRRGAANAHRGRLRRRRDPRRQRLSAGPVRQGRRQQAHRRLWRIDREPRQADARGRRRRWPPKPAPSAPASASRR